MRGLVQDSPIGGRFSQCQKGLKRGFVTPHRCRDLQVFVPRKWANVKKVPNAPFRGSTKEKLASEIFRFGYAKAANDKMVPDRVGSGCFSLCTDLRKSAEERSVQKVTS